MKEKKELLEIKVRLANNRRRDYLAERIYHYVNGTRDYDEKKVILNKDCPRIVQIFFDNDTSEGITTGIYDMIIKFIS